MAGVQGGFNLRFGLRNVPYDTPSRRRPSRGSGRNLPGSVEIRLVDRHVAELPTPVPTRKRRGVSRLDGEDVLGDRVCRSDQFQASQGVNLRGRVDLADRGEDTSKRVSE